MNNTANTRNFSAAQVAYMEAKAAFEVAKAANTDPGPFEAYQTLKAATEALFDWATEESLAKHGTAAQKKEVRTAVAKVKTMSTVQAHHIRLVDICMKLDMAA